MRVEKKIMTIKNEYTLTGLCCSNCAAVIEDKVGKLPWVKEARVNLATQILYLDSDRENVESRKQLQALVDSIEDGIVVEHREDVKERPPVKDRRVSEALKKRIPELAGAFLFLIMLLLKGNETLSLSLRGGLYGIAYLLIGRRVLVRGLKNMRKGRFLDENFLMIIATAGAFAIQEFTEAVAVMLFYLLGEFFQDMAVDRSRRSIRSLMDSKPGLVQVIRGDSIELLPPGDVKPGTLYRLRPGDRVPLDGEIMKGEGSMDTSALTGESYPRHVSKGSEVLSGFVNREALIEVCSTKSLSESSYSRIIRLVEESSNRKARSEQFITRFARIYTPVVVGFAVLLALIPPLIIDGNLSRDWLYRALVFLVVSCPCALVISIPLGFFAGIGRASREGILVKGGNYLEALNSIETVFIDKTGTLTKGVFSVTSLRPEPGFDENQLLKFAAAAESHSSHPIAESILRSWRGRGGSTVRADQVEESAGQGLSALYEGHSIRVGKPEWSGYPVGQNEETSLSEGTTVYVSLDGNPLGSIHLSDVIRPDAVSALKDLREGGIKEIFMLTGDSSATAEAVASSLGLDGVKADLMPHQKVEAVEESMQKGKRTAFMGDGINDAPVLARADVGIAMGGLGSDAAIEAADIVLMADEPSRLVRARKIARKTRHIVIQNIVMALGIKSIILVMAGLGYAGMGLAVFGDVGVALLAVFNVLRIMSDREPTSLREPGTVLSGT